MRKILAACLAYFLAYRAVIAASLWLFPLPVNILERDYSTLNLDRDSRLLRITLSPGGAYRLRLPLAKISPDAQRGFLLYEDRYLYFHDGVNLPALLQAGVTNLIHGHVRRGGSTLTMQIAKLMEPKPRTLWAKCLEIARAWHLESRCS